MRIFAGPRHGERAAQAGGKLCANKSNHAVLNTLFRGSETANFVYYCRDKNEELMCSVISQSLIMHNYVHLHGQSAPVTNHVTIGLP